MNQLTQVSLGDILWLKTPQTLAPLDRAQDLSDKVRPFIVLSPTEIRTDHNSIATQDRSLLGVNCTSQDFLVNGRPHISFTLQGQNKTTYALLDSIRNVGTIEQSMVCRDRLSSSEQENLLEKLDEIIRPEKRFYVRDFFNFKKPIMPGQIHRIKTIDTDGPALVLLKRGKFVVNDDVDCSNDFNGAVHQTRFTPYLVLYFQNTQWSGTLRGINPNDIRVLAVHERDIHEKLGEITHQNVGNILNQIRRNAHLQPIRYNKIDLRHRFSVMPLMKIAMR